jgi:uncharacterized protein with GYD domain
MGEYDYIAITESPSDEDAMVQLAAIAAAGNGKTKTLKNRK